MSKETDLYPIEAELQRLKEMYYSGRNTGRTTHIVYKIIDDLYNYPINTEILVEDHYHTQQATHSLITQIKKFVDNFCPDLKYKIHVSDGDTYIIRTDDTYREKVFNRIKTLTKQLENDKGKD